MAEALLSELEGLEGEIPADLLEELHREIARNEEANRLAKEREREAKEARERAAKSQQMMESMMQRYDAVKQKVEMARRTLVNTSVRVERQEHLVQCLADLKERAERMAETRRALELARGANGKKSVTSGGPRVDYALTVQRLQEKLASKNRRKQDEQEEAERQAMAVEETKTEEAKGLAIQKELEARQAQDAAEKKEEEAKEMRRKVEEMQKLLAERKNKLMITEHAIAKKGAVVERVEKILHSKERRANYVERKRVEKIVFSKPKPSPE